jgi:hypothetical protein
MTPHAEAVWARFEALDRALQANGFPATSPWWKDTLREFYETGKGRLVLRVGRRGGKSSTLCRLAVVEALWGQHAVPPGDVGVVAVVSARRPDALERLRTIGAILDAIGVRYTTKGDSLELLDRRVVFTVFTASIAGVSGFTSIFVLLDEVAKWRDSDTGANPAAIVIASVAPTLATQKNGRMVLSSSPMGLMDAHADAYGRGSNAGQMVAHAPSWVANPTLSEERTRELESDEVAWAREYAAIPQAEGETSHLTESMVNRCTRSVEGDLEPDERHHYVAVIDPATRGNAWTLVVATLGDRAVRRVVLCREWRGSKKAPLSPSGVFGEIAKLIRPYRLGHVISDQFSEDSLRELARLRGLTLVVQAWTAPLKADAYDGLKTLGQATLLDLPPDPVLKTDLLGIRVKLTRSGVSYELATQGARHSDYAPAVGMAVMECRVPPRPVPLGDDDEFRKRFLSELEREKRRGRMPVTHGKLARQAGFVRR